MKNIPLSLYIHFPWCVKKCPYCDFNSHQSPDVLPEDEYITALLCDLDRDLALTEKREIQSIFMGGGTPSLFSPTAMERLLQALSKRVEFAEDIEITLEANPGASDYEKFSGYHSAGINRLSIGAQSFNQSHLDKLGRIHSTNEIIEAVHGARKAGFTNFNIDLMHGLNKQSLEGAMFDLDQGIALAPTHISWYQLTIEANTQFYKNPPVLPEDEVLWQIYEGGLEKLAEHGYERYEVSAFSQVNRRAKHNLNYWLFGDYIGIGAGAHGKLTKDGLITRTSKTRIPKDYLLEQRAKRDLVPESELVTEFLMNSLRLNEGFSITLFEERTGLKADHLDQFMKRASEAKLIERNGKNIRASTLGLQYLNNLLLLI